VLRSEEKGLPSEVVHSGLGKLRGVLSFESDFGVSISSPLALSSCRLQSLLELSSPLLVAVEVVSSICLLVLLV